MLRLRPPAPRPASPSPAPRHKAALAASGGRGAAAARARETKAGREPTFRGFGGPAPRPGLGEGEGPPLGEEQCGRRPRPLAALGDRRAASRCSSRESGRGRGGAGGPHVCRERGRPGRPHVGPPPRADAESAASAGPGPQHVAPRCARASVTRPRRPVRARAPKSVSRGLCLPGCARRRPRGTGARCPPRSIRAQRTLGAQRSPPPPDWRPSSRCSPSVARSLPGAAVTPPGSVATGPSPPASGAGVGLVGRWGAGPEVRGGKLVLSLSRRSATSCAPPCHSQAASPLEVPAEKRVLWPPRPGSSPTGTPPPSNPSTTAALPREKPDSGFLLGRTWRQLGGRRQEKGQVPQPDGKPALGPDPHLPAETAAVDRAVSATSPWAVGHKLQEANTQTVY
ncbi:basic salivary proline-rich protein 3-like [Odocoileus virginianus]|uniref:Basic salivary proline-rich protein 3-like n=1 Tax=Odocoileus virginianus TaxID=9874 RepID=A0ABM4J0M8_ODOVR